MVNVLALRFNVVRVGMGHSDVCLSPLRARAAYAGGMLTIEKTSEQTADEKIAELAVPESEPRRAARALYWKGWRISSIARHLGIKRSTINSWKERDEWDKAQAIEHVEASAELRLIKLIEKEIKSGSDYKEIDLLARTIVQMARVRRYEQPGGNEVDLNPKLANRNAGPKKKPMRNDFSEEQKIQLLDAFQDSLFDYQKVWYRNGDQRTRAILKSRQIGATWYFAREALADAMQTGRNQIFLSASKSQAHVFKQYIVQFAREAAGIDLTGDPIVLPNGAHLYFLGTNARTAQGYHGNFYFDEFFWTHNFTELNKVASGMAMQKCIAKPIFRRRQPPPMRLMRSGPARGSIAAAPRATRSVSTSRTSVCRQASPAKTRFGGKSSRFWTQKKAAATCSISTSSATSNTRRTSSKICSCVISSTTLRRCFRWLICNAAWSIPGPPGMT